MGYKLGVSICLIGGTSQLSLSVIKKKHPRKDITRFLFENPTAYFNTKVPLSAFETLDT